jgi:uncharacterized protein YndB with AHSA1/START domain
MGGDATLLDADGRWTLRFERRFAHPVDKVWRCLAEAEHRDIWFPQRILGDLVVGGDLQFVEDPNLPAESLGGRCLAIDPPNLLELEWGEDVLRIELAPDGDGTRMVFLDMTEDRPHAARTAAGWHHCLDVLQAGLDGTTSPELDAGGWDALHGRYLAALGGERHVWGSTPT